MNRFKVLISSVASVTGGVTLGVFWERKKGEERRLLPVVNAATAVVPSGDVGSAVVKRKPHLKFGFPSLDQLRFKNDYVLSYDRKHRTAHWVFEHLTPETCEKKDGVNRDQCNFIVDTSIHPFFQSSHADYKYSGFDRGHLAAAGNHRATMEQCQETFLYSNMSPQVGEGFNRGAWNNLERLIRKLARHNSNVYVMTGPLYLPRQEPDGKLYVKYQVIGQNQVAVPTHFFKVALVESSPGAYDLHSFVLPNQAIPEHEPLNQFYQNLESIERSAGFLLFDKLPRTAVKRINGVPAGTQYPALLPPEVVHFEKEREAVGLAALGG